MHKRTSRPEAFLRAREEAALIKAALRHQQEQLHHVATAIGASFEGYRAADEVCSAMRRQAGALAVRPTLHAVVK
jgi:hypothetical protein